MGISAKTRRAPLRLTTGAFILNSGLSKFGADEATAAYLHSSAARLSPRLQKVDPKTLAKGLAAGEVALGTALLVPVVPPVVAGAGLCAFAGSLLTMWWRTPGMHLEGSIRPTQEGIAVAKDVWMLGSGASLVVDALTSPAHDKRVEISATVQEKAAAKKRGVRRARQRAAASDKVQLASERLHDARGRIVELRDEYQPVAAEKLKSAAKVARQSAQDAGIYVSDLRDEYQPVAAKKLKKAKKKARKKSKELAKSVR